MKLVRSTIHGFLALVAVSTVTAGGVDYGTISSAVAHVLEEAHYSRHPLNSDLSKQFLTEYLDNLDADHLFFTRADVDAIMAGHAATIGEDVLAGRLDPALEIFDLYKKRVNERVDKIGEWIKSGPFDFTGTRTVELSRDHAPWLADDSTADQTWRDRIVGELLDDKLNGTSLDECKKTVWTRYDELRNELLKESKKEAVAVFLNSLASAYDPHSEYLRKEDLEDLDSDMSLSMVGIGVVIEAQGRYTRITSLLPGSPAAASGRLKVNDRIVAIAKGEGGFVNVSGMSIDRVLSFLRSKPGTRVRLRVIAPDAAAAARSREISLVSRSIELVDDAAKADLVERQLPDGKKERLGWISLPSFYGEPGQPGARSVTTDVRNLVASLKKENVSGMVIDLRNNPGGELEEAVGVAGLFLGKVPIVQEKDRTGKIYVSKAEERRLYDGPLVVITDHLTASAAELLACALQDYGRAVVVGGLFPTYGKGSVQTIVSLGDVLQNVNPKESDQLGALQLTIAKFYRVNGQSTQLHGLTADIQLPSPEDLPNEGESDMKNPLVYDETKPLPLAVKGATQPLPIARLKELSATRIAADQEFKYLTEDLERTRNKEIANSLSLNEAVRRAETEESKARDRQREAARKLFPPTAEIVIHIVPSSRISNPYQPLPTLSTPAPAPDPIRTESLNILSDLARISARKSSPADQLAQNSTKPDPATKAR
ncbi:MAG: carboxy terminal-processing peptidase [Chthoniobacteraceae bacterium]